MIDNIPANLVQVVSSEAKVNDPLPFYLYTVILREGSDVSTCTTGILATGLYSCTAFYC
jgi:hypothetical protein